MDGGPESIQDAAIRAAVRKQARRVHLKSAALAVVLTALAVVV
jgi:hypothetical protein